MKKTRPFWERFKRAAGWCEAAAGQKGYPFGAAG